MLHESQERAGTACRKLAAICFCCQQFVDVAIVNVHSTALQFAACMWSRRSVGCWSKVGKVRHSKLSGQPLGKDVEQVMLVAHSLKHLRFVIPCSVLAIIHKQQQGVLSTIDLLKAHAYRKHTATCLASACLPSMSPVTKETSPSKNAR